jgi:hypothetical protein
MHHIGTVTKSSRLPELPFHAQCSCGTAGSFFEAEQARQYLRNHGLKVQAEGVTNTFALVDNSDKPEEKAVLPKPHVAGVGNMPTSHAALGEEKIPSPPEAHIGVDLRGEQKTTFVPDGGALSTAPPAPPAPPDAKK